MKPICFTFILTTLLISFLSVHAQSWLTNGLVAYYPFNGNANDASGNGCNGITNNTTFTSDRFGYSNSSCYFDGASSYIVVTNTSQLSPTEDFSVSVWVNPMNLQSLPMAVISKSQAYNDSDSSWFIFYEPADFGLPKTIQFQANPNFGIDSPTILPPSAGQWHQLVYTYARASSSCASYLDGVLVDVRLESYITINPNRELTIGCQEVLGGLDYFFNGSIDDIRIYKRALANTEVQQLYQLEAPPIVNLNKAVWLSFSNLKNGTNYQVQVSTNLSGAFSNYGSPFTATNSTMIYPAYWNVPDWGQLFFRLETLP